MRRARRPGRIGPLSRRRRAVSRHRPEPDGTPVPSARDLGRRTVGAEDGDSMQQLAPGRPGRRRALSRRRAGGGGAASSSSSRCVVAQPRGEPAGRTGGWSPGSSSASPMGRRRRPVRPAGSAPLAVWFLAIAAGAALYGRLDPVRSAPHDQRRAPPLPPLANAPSLDPTPHARPDRRPRALELRAGAWRAAALGPRPRRPSPSWPSPPCRRAFDGPGGSSAATTGRRAWRPRPPPRRWSPGGGGPRATDDPLPAWLVAGAVAAWLAVVPTPPTSVGRLPGDATSWRAAPPARHRAAARRRRPDRADPRRPPRCRVVPSTASSSGRSLDRRHRHRVHGARRRPGPLVGGSGPTWFLVAATGAIASAWSRPASGSADWPTASSTAPATTRSRGRAACRRPRRRRLRRRAAAGAGRQPGSASCASTPSPSTCATADGWQRAASPGPSTTHHGRCSLATAARWSAASSSAGRRAVAAAAATSSARRAGRPAERWQWAGSSSPPSCADRAWPIVSAREEERRRLRRDLHDGLGPALTGISLGLRTAVRQLGRSTDADGVAPGPDAARAARRRGRRRRGRAQADRARPAPDGARPARPARRGRRVHPQFDDELRDPPGAAAPSPSRCRRRSRWRPTAS